MSSDVPETAAAFQVLAREKAKKKKKKKTRSEKGQRMVARNFLILKAVYVLFSGN